VAFHALEPFTMGLELQGNLVPGFISLSVLSKGSSMNKGQSSFMIFLPSVRVLEKLLVGDLAARAIGFHGGHLLLALVVEFGDGQAPVRVLLPLPRQGVDIEQEQGVVLDTALSRGVGYGY
jgi:hypothetical protein